MENLLQSFSLSLAQNMRFKFDLLKFPDTCTCTVLPRVHDIQCTMQHILCLQLQIHSVFLNHNVVNMNLDFTACEPEPQRTDSVP